MSLLSLTKKVAGEKKPAKKAKEGKAVAKKATEKKSTTKKASVGNVRLAGEIGLSVLLSEKSLAQQAQQTMVVRVIPAASKGQIAKAIEELFGVKVLAVRTSRLHPKVRRRAATVGRTVHFKKAYVKVDDIAKLNVAP